MTKMIYLVLFVLLFGVTSFAENHLVYFGGGRSATPDDASFDAGLMTLIQYSEMGSWQSEFYYRKTPPVSFSERDRKLLKEFSPDSFHEKISSLKKDIQSGKIKAGEQLLIYLDTHGSLDENRNFLLTTDQDYVQAQALQSLIALAEDHEVKLGVVGLTCYSGSLLRYRTPNTCIVAMSQPDKVSFSDDGDQMVQHMLMNAGATNLEEAFLQARFRGEDRYSPSQPMISSEAGVLTDEALYPVKFGIYYDYDVEVEQRGPMCRNTTLQIESLPQKIEDLTQLMKMNVPFEEKRVKSLQEMLAKYDSLYNQSRDFSILGGRDVCAGDEVCLRVFEVDLFQPETKQQKAWVEEMRQTDEYKKFKAVAKKKDRIFGKMQKLSAKIAREERELYDLFYRANAAKSTAPNPCRDFKL